MAEEATTESVGGADTPFDLSSSTQQLTELGIPTITSIDTLKANADTLWDNQNYTDAAAAYAKYAKQVNWFANISSSGLEPYYGASYDDRKDFSPTQFSVYDLSSYENASNSYKTERNRAILYEGLCYYHLGDYTSALPLLIKALDLIDIQDEVNWKVGMEALYAIIGYK